MAFRELTRGMIIVPMAGLESLFSPNRWSGQRAWDVRRSPGSPQLNTPKRLRSIAIGLISYLIMAAGIAFTFRLVSQIPDGVFYSGDGGLKFDLARRMLHGDTAIRGELESDPSPWAKDLWARGLSPFRPPFVYERDGKSFVAFPTFFPALTAPWYELFGFPGLYVVPLLSAWFLWALFTWTGPHCGVSSTATAVALAGIVFGSPLTLYAAMYWEHTAGAVLAFAGLALLVTRTSPSLSAGAIAGFLFGLSGWLRPELALFALLACILSILFPLIGGGRRTQLGLAFGVSILLLVFALWNLGVSGTLGGFQSLQWGSDDRGLLAPALERLKALLGLLPQWYPLAPAAVVGFVGLLFRSRSASRAATVGGFLLALSLLFVVLVPFAVPRVGGKQLGPRYLLVLVPVLGLLLALSADQLWASRRPLLRLLVVLVLGGTLAAGIHRNTLVGAHILLDDYAHRIKPLLAMISEDPTPVVVVSDQHIAQELVVLWGSRTFFLVRDSDDLTRLVSGMRRQGKSRFLLLTYRNWPSPSDCLVNTDDGTVAVRFSPDVEKGVCKVSHGEVTAN